MQAHTVERPVDVMITPQFYTMKKEVLPVKYLYQAKRIAPSLFDGLLEGDVKHDYFVYRDGDTWVFIAYDIAEIISFLEKKGIPAQKIGKIYFAQQAVEHFDKPVPLGEHEALSVIDGTVVVVPVSALQDVEFGAFGERFRPTKALRSEIGGGSLLNRKHAIVLSVLLALFGVIWLIEGMRHGGGNDMLSSRLNELYERHPALQSTYARNSILEKYRKIDVYERKKREIIKRVSGLIFKGVTLTELELGQKEYKVVFALEGKDVAKRFTTLLETVGFVKSSDTSEDKVIVKGKL
jgi:hypothetical protein